MIDEFKNKIESNGRINNKITDKNIISKYNKKKYKPAAGELIRILDKLTAFIETYASIELGIHPASLIQAHNKIYKDYKNSKFANIDFGKVFNFFYVDTR